MEVLNPHSGETIIGATTRQVIKAMDDAGFLRVQLNRAELYLPRETVRTMVHCLHLGPQGELTLLVETDHYDWMAAQIKPGDHFIDVGSATGAICLPLAKRFGANLPIIAFEPARLARALLLSTCRRNNLNSIRIIGKAVSNQRGRVPFYELPQDDLSPWLPEGSTLAAGDERAERVDVMVTTLDAEFESLFARPRIQSAVMKIDVEGFETKVLEGGRGFLQRVRPSIAIDIHANPFGEGTTEPSCRQILETLGYAFEKTNHVLLCTPAR